MKGHGRLLLLIERTAAGEKGTLFKEIKDILGIHIKIILMYFKEEMKIGGEKI